MIEQKAPVISDGLRLDGAFFTDENVNNPDLPIVIVCSGFTGQKNIHPERYARALTAKALQYSDLTTVALANLRVFVSELFWMNKYATSPTRLRL